MEEILPVLAKLIGQQTINKVIASFYTLDYAKIQKICKILRTHAKICNFYTWTLNSEWYRSWTLLSTTTSFSGDEPDRNARSFAQRFLSVSVKRL